MKTGKLFYIFCVLFVVGWFAIRASATNYLVAFSFGSFALAWAIYRLPTRVSKETLGSFFLYERTMPKNEFIGTLVTTNIGFFSSVAFSCYIVATMGIGPAVILVIAWIAGLLWFAYYIPNLLPFLRRGSTLHEYIAASYGRTPEQTRHLRLYSSVITVVLYLASVGAEIKFTADVFAAPTGIAAGWLAIALSIAGILYVSISGYRGVVATGRLQFWSIILGVGALYYFIFHTKAAASLNFTTDFLSFKNMTVGSSPLALSSLVILLALYQFCVMDMWERCIAIAKSRDISGGAEPDSQEAVHSIVTSMRRMLVLSIIPFVVLFGAWYGVGLLAVGQNWGADPNQIIPELLTRLRAFAMSGLAGAITESLVVLCFTAAALSTIDGFIIAGVQTVVCDWFPSFTQSRKEWNELTEADAARWLTLARLLSVVMGMLAVGIAYLSFAVINFWVGMYSLMLSFFPAVFLKIARPDFSRPATQVIASIVCGAGAALIAAIFGTFVFPEKEYLMSLPPFLAFGVSGLILIPPAIRTRNLLILCAATAGCIMIWYIRP